MLTPRSIKPVFGHLDKDLIIRWSSTGNHLLFGRSVNTAFGLPWVTAAPDHLIIDNPTVIEPVDVLIGGSISSAYKQWEDLNVENVAVDTPSSVLFGEALSASLLMANIDTPQIVTRLRTLARAHFEGSTQTTIQDEIKEIIDWYTEKVSQIPKVEKVKYKLRKKSIEFLVVVNHIRGGISRQLSQIESQLCDEYTNWFFEFEHIGSRAFSRQSRAGYTNLFNRD